MSKMRSIRLTASEDIKLKALAQTSGFLTVSAFIRHQLGLNPEPVENKDAVPSIEDIDLSMVLPYMVIMMETLNRLERGIKRVCKTMGVVDMEAVPTKHEPKSKQAGFVRV